MLSYEARKVFAREMFSVNYKILKESSSPLTFKRSKLLFEVDNCRPPLIRFAGNFFALLTAHSIMFSRT